VVTYFAKHCKIIYEFLNEFYCRHLFMTLGLSLATYKETLGEQGEWLILAINNTFLCDSFNDYRGQFKDHLMSILELII